MRAVICRELTGVGGLEWSAVKPLMRQHLGVVGVPVVVYDVCVKGARDDEGLG